MMCIFCGGQCGGLGDFFFSIGLPFLWFYSLKIKNSLAKVKNKFSGIDLNANEKQNAKVQCGCCAEPGFDFGKLVNHAVDPHDLNLVALKGQPNESAMLNNNIITTKKERLKGVKGWLLLLCLNLLLFIPASYIYQTSCNLTLICNQPRYLLFISSVHYTLFLMVVMISLAIFSFYAGYGLWNQKAKAVKIAKIFLIIQFSLTSLLYLHKSIRVRNTYEPVEASPPLIRPFHAELPGQIKFS